MGYSTRGAKKDFHLTLAPILGEAHLAAPLASFNEFCVRFI